MEFINYKNTPMNIKLLYISLAIILFHSSCLKDEPYALDPKNGHNVIEFYHVTTPISGYLDPVNVYVAGNFEPKDEVEFTAAVNYAGPEDLAPKDIQVQLAISPETLAKHNAVKSNKYELLPEGLYEFPSTVTIKKGEKVGKFQVKLHTNKFDNNKSNALAIAITSTSHAVISANSGAVIFSVPVKSLFDGNYTVTATAPLVDIDVSSISGYYPLDANLVTVRGNSVAMYSNTYLNGAAGHPIKNNNTDSYYGNFSPVFHFDENNKVVAVTNHFGQGNNANGRAARLDPSGLNTFTIQSDGSKVLEVKYIMVQNGVDKTFFSERWTFVKAR